MSYTNRNFGWDFDSLKRFYDRYVVKWLNSAESWTSAQKKQARANLGFGGGDIDDKPTAGSDNLVKSGGIYLKINSIKEETLEENRQMVNSIMENYAPVEIIGDVNNAADEEDLTSVNVEGTDVLKFKDKAYNPLVYSGLGRKILRKNIVNGVNILTQDMFYKGEAGSRVPNTNTIFVIQYDYVIDSANDNTITIPENCVLEFDGGSLRNGSIVGNSTCIQAGLVKIFDLDIVVEGSWDVSEVYPEWFGAVGDGVTDDTEAIQKAFNFGISLLKKDICLSNKYNISSTLMITRPTEERGIIKIKGGGKIIAATGITVIKATNQYTSDITLENLEFKGDKIAVDMENGKLIRLNVDECTFDSFEHSFYSSDLVQDLHISRCIFLRHTDYVIKGIRFYTTTIENNIAEFANKAFLYVGTGYPRVVGNTLEGFSSETEPVIRLINGAIYAVNNHVEQNKCNFITLGNSTTATLYGSYIANNRQENERNTEPTVKILGRFIEAPTTICNNNFPYGFKNETRIPVFAYGNTVDGQGPRFGRSLMKSTEYDFCVTNNKHVFSAVVTVPISGDKDVCKITKANISRPFYVKFTIIGTLVNTGDVYCIAEYFGSTEISKTGSPNLVSKVSFTNDVLTIATLGYGGDSSYTVVAEVYGGIITDYIHTT